MRRRFHWVLMLFGICVGTTLVWAGGDLPTKFTNRGGVTNTRHNMSLRGADGFSLLSNAGSGEVGTIMDPYRNNYGEVCVYCHTPHGADTSAAVPLWNRKLPTTTVYTTYDKLDTTSLTQTVSQPGAASLPCLSCHDGQQAVDAIRNMPGSGKYQANPDNTFLDNAWSTGPAVHFGLNYSETLPVPGCLLCHATTGPYVAILGQGAADFSPAYIGTDLRNDHPVGVTFPTANGTGTDWKTPNGSVTRGTLSTAFFDENINGRMDKGEIRLYDSGNGASVECASCHDPHGVPSAGVGSQFNPTFLRKTNVGSAVCMTCHAK